MIVTLKRWCPVSRNCLMRAIGLTPLLPHVTAHMQRGPRLGSAAAYRGLALHERGSNRHAHPFDPKGDNAHRRSLRFFRNQQYDGWSSAQITRAAGLAQVRACAGPCH